MVNRKDDKGRYIEVFDFVGNPIARYELQGERPRYFAVDEETFTLYSPMKGFPEDHLMMYKLEGLSLTVIIAYNLYQDY